MNKALKKKEISRLINASFRRCGLRATVIFADQLMQNGFKLATRGGISIAIDDMLIPPSKATILSAAEREVKEIEQQYTSGLRPTLECTISDMSRRFCGDVSDACASVSALTTSA